MPHQSMVLKNALFHTISIARNLKKIQNEIIGGTVIFVILYLYVIVNRRNCHTLIVIHPLKTADWQSKARTK
jgi:hypothetical protein